MLTTCPIYFFVFTGFATNILLVPIMVYIVKVTEEEPEQNNTCGYICVFLIVLCVPFAYTVWVLLFSLFYCCIQGENIEDSVIQTKGTLSPLLVDTDVKAPTLPSGPGEKVKI